MSSNQSEIFFLEKCIVLIEKKLNWGSSKNWKQRDFENLEELIFEKTGVNLSLSTLKRLWKKNSGSTPQMATLNALASFLGYKKWYYFKQDQIPRIPQDTLAATINKKNKFKLKRPIIVIILVTIGIISIALISLPRSFFSREKEVVFTSKKVVTEGVPNTVIFEYDISMLDFEKAQIKQGWNPNLIADISKDNHYYTCIYYYPSYHHAQLLVDGQVLREHQIHITTDGWIGLVQYDLYDPIPIYLPQSQIFQDNMMYVNPEILEQNKVDLMKQQYFVSFYNIRDFGNLDSDHFSFETQIRNNLNEGGLTCQTCLIIIRNEYGMLSIPLCAPGCIGDIFLMLNEKYIGSNDHDLSSFGCDLSQWQTLKCMVKDKVVSIFLNDQCIYESTYSIPGGKVKGIHYVFLGCGAVNYTKFFDDQGEIVYDENFENLEKLQLGFDS